MISHYVISDPEQPRKRAAMVAAAPRAVSKGAHERLCGEILSRKHADPPRNKTQDPLVMTLIELREDRGLLNRSLDQSIVLNNRLHDLYVEILAQKIPDTKEMRFRGFAACSSRLQAGVSLPDAPGSP